MTIVRAAAGTPASRSSRGSRRGGASGATSALHERDRELARREQREQRRQELHPQPGARDARRQRTAAATPASVRSAIDPR